MLVCFFPTGKCQIPLAFRQLEAKISRPEYVYIFVNIFSLSMYIAVLSCYIQYFNTNQFPNLVHIILLYHLLYFVLMNIHAGLMLSTDREHSFTILSGTRTVQFTCPVTSTAPPVTFRWLFRPFAHDTTTEVRIDVNECFAGIYKIHHDLPHL